MLPLETVSINYDAVVFIQYWALTHRFNKAKNYCPCHIGNNWGQQHDK
jgi:hypothetical protein